jgi:chitinase
MVLLPLVAMVALFGSFAAAQDKIVMCYFGSWSTYRWGNGEFDVENIDPFICTHLMFGFAGLDPNTDKIKVLDPYNELYDNWGKGAYQRFTGLKLFNPNLKTILAIGGWNEGSTAYSHMATTAERRKVFIDSCVALVLEHGFDGLDLDWEYPGEAAEEEAVNRQSDLTLQEAATTPLASPRTRSTSPTSSARCASSSTSTA